MRRRTLTGFVFLLALAGPSGCVHFEPKPITAPANLAAVEARTLDAPELGAFLEANHEVAVWPPPAWTFQTLTLAAFY
jgi:hypothetical protein